jgi:hypothetical protein
MGHDIPRQCNNSLKTEKLPIAIHMQRAKGFVEHPTRLAWEHLAWLQPLLLMLTLANPRSAM